MKPEPSRREIIDMAQGLCVGLGNCIEAKHSNEEIEAWGEAAKWLMKLGGIVSARQKRVSLHGMTMSQIGRSIAKSDERAKARLQ